MPLSLLLLLPARPAWPLLAPAQNSAGQAPDAQLGLGLVIGLILIGLAYGLARRNKRG